MEDTRLPAASATASWSSGSPARCSMPAARSASAPQKAPHRSSRWGSSRAWISSSRRAPGRRFMSSAAGLAIASIYGRGGSSSARARAPGARPHRRRGTGRARRLACDADACSRPEGRDAMSWDFSTDPDYQEQLDWMAELVRREIWPLEAIWHDLGLDGLTAAIAPLQTRAVRDGEDWVIDGNKWFSSNGSIADFLIVMAVTSPDARPFQRASMFIVPVDTPGVEILRDVPTMEHPWEQFGGYGGHSEITYNSVRVPAEALLGGEGEGFGLAQQRLGPGRIHHCMRWLGVARRAFDMMCERATYRQAHGSVLAQKQTVQSWIADSAAEMQAARLMTLHAAWVMDTEGHRAARTDVALIKFYGANVLHDVVDRALQVHGSLGYSTDLPLEQMYRFARAARIYDGPDEVHRQTVARHILAGYQPPADDLPSEHLPTRREQARERFAHLLEAVTAND